MPNAVDPSGRFANVIAGALAGAIAGTMLGYANAVATYELGINGHCGCEMKQLLTQIGPGEYMKSSLGMGLLFGAVIGAIVSLPLSPLASTILFVVGAIDIAQKIGSVIEDFLDNLRIDNYCTLAELVVEFIGESIALRAFDANNSSPASNNGRRRSQTSSNTSSGDNDIPQEIMDEAAQFVDNYRREAESSYGAETIASVRRPKLPSWKKLRNNVDWDHITSNHRSWGDGVRAGGDKTLWPDEWSDNEILLAIQEAYNNQVYKSQTRQGYLIRGALPNGNLVEFWINTTDNAIESAYPVGWTG